jgi:hypothetical protein
MIETTGLFLKSFIFEDVCRLPVHIWNSILVECSYVSRIIQQTAPIFGVFVAVATTMRMDGESITSASGKDWTPGVATLCVTIIAHPG